MDDLLTRQAPDARGRTCVGCGRKQGQGEFLRIRTGPAGPVVEFGRGAGRGAYLCPEAGCLELAVGRKALHRALRADLGSLSVTQLREAIDRAVMQRVLRIVSLARRSRKAVAGVHAVTRALEAGRVRVLLLGREMSPRVGAALKGLAEGRGIPVVAGLSRDEVTSALGDPSRVAIGLLDGTFADGVLRWLRLRASVGTGSGESGGAQRWGTGGGRHGEDARI